MSGIAGAINTALSGLELFEAGINAVSNNLANQATPGYTVESVTANTQDGPVGQPGDGVQPAVLTRAASGFAAAQLRAANAASAAATAQATNLTSISNALTNNGDVQTAINQFFQDVSTLAADPTSAAQRQTVLADAQSVTSSFQNAAGVLNGVVTSASATLTQSVSSANNALQQLASLNDALAVSPNDAGLLDQQQAALNTLSSLLPASVLPQSDGGVIITSGGTVLLDQSGAQTLSVVAGSGTTPPSVTAGADATPLPAGEADGAIGSAVASYAAGQAALQGLGAIAAIFTNAVNTSQAEGLTPGGAQGGALFSVPAPSVTANAANTGTAVVSGSLTNGAALPIDGGPFTLSYGSSGWSAVDNASGASYTVSGTPPSFAGLTLAITGTPAVGDSFIVNPAPDAATGIAVAATQPDTIAAADPYVATPGVLQSDGAVLDSNGGVIAGGADSVTASPASGAAVIPASYFGQSLQLNFTSATAYTVTTTANPSTVIASGTLTGGTGNVAVAYPAGAASGTYWQLPVTGTPDAGDVLTLTPGGPSSGSNATRLAAIWTASGTTTAGTLQQAIIGFGTQLGANAQAAQQLQTAATDQVTTATATLQNVAGVNTDEQAVTLTNYQQAYQAAAQAISAAHTMFESLLQSV